MSITEVEDLTMFCRVCLQLPAESELLDLNLIYDEDEQLTYYDCFTMCTQIQISDGEGLPQNLCRSCGLELQMAYDFYKKVDESKRFLIQLQDQQTKALLPATEEEFDSTTPLLGEQEEIVEQEQEEEVVEEEHLDMEEYQAVEHLDEEESDDKTHVLIKEEGSEEYGEETLVDDNEVTFYKEYIIEHITEEGEQENMQPKKEVIEKFSESENEVDEDEELTFENLYEKVFEDIKNEQIEKTEEHISTKKIRLKRRRRGRPRLDGRSEDEDDTDLMLDEIDAYDRQNQHTNKIQHNTSDEDRKCLEENEVAEESDAANAVRMKRKRRGPPFKNEQKGPPYECEICQAICKTRSLLNSHRFRKHRPQNEPRFSCSKCHRKFLTQQALEKHTRRPTCESYPQFDCEHCGKKCIGLSNYNIHLRFHKRQYPFVCHLCGKKFMMCVHLNEHVLVKHENKRYPCEHPGCGKLFQTRNSLYNHSYQHSGYMPFECEYCKRGYASKSRLRFHCKKSHNIDHSIEELDRMQVTEKLPNPVVKPQ